jgi:hypothetical protein
VITATAPITYDDETQTVGIDQSGLTLSESQVTDLINDLNDKKGIWDVEVKNTSFTSEPNHMYHVDCTSGVITHTLPLSPSEPCEILVIPTHASTGHYVSNVTQTGNTMTTANTSGLTQLGEASTGQGMIFVWPGYGTVWYVFDTIGVMAGDTRYVMKTWTNAIGDLLVGYFGQGISSRLAVGSNYKVLTADSNVSGYGLGWAEPGAVKNINAQTANYTTGPDDAGKFITFTKATAGTITVPPYSSVAYPVGAVLEGANLGAGQLTLTPGTGVTINGSPGLKVNQWGSFRLIKVAADNTWLANGQLVA